MEVCLNFFHIVIACVSRYINYKPYFCERHLNFFLQLSSAAIECTLGVDRHRFNIDAVLMGALVPNYIRTSDERRYQGFSWCWPHIGSITLFRFVKNRPDITNLNLRSRMGRTVPVNTLRDSRFFLDSHNAFSSYLVVLLAQELVYFLR
jgi:hypothetical protein